MLGKWLGFKLGLVSWLVLLVHCPVKILKYVVTADLFREKPLTSFCFFPLIFGLALQNNLKHQSCSLRDPQTVLTSCFGRTAHWANTSYSGQSRNINLVAYHLMFLFLPFPEYEVQKYGYTIIRHSLLPLYLQTRRM